jgi:hypothetical protein
LRSSQRTWESLGVKARAPGWTAVQLGAQLALIALFTVACRYRRAIAQTEKRNSGRSRLTSQAADEAGGETSAPGEQRPAPTLVMRIADTAMMLLRGIITTTLRYIVWVTVFVVYVAALEDVTLINAFYLIILITFMGFPQIRERYWVSLVIYCEVVLLVLYLWGFPIHGHHVAVENLLGLDAGIHDHMWRSLQWHIAILLLSSIQLLLFRWTQSASTLKRSAPAVGEGGDGSSSTVMDISASPEAESPGQSRSWVVLLESAVRTVWPIVIAIAVTCAGLLGHVNLFRLGYLGLYGLQLLLRTMNLHSAASRWEFVIMLYAAAVLIMKYMYQFSSLRRRLTHSVSEDLLQDIGLRTMTTQLRLFLYLVSLPASSWVHKTVVVTERRIRCQPPPHLLFPLSIFIFFAAAIISRLGGHCDIRENSTIVQPGP